MKTKIVHLGKVMSFLTCHPANELRFLWRFESIPSAECNLVSSGGNCVWELKIGLEVHETTAALIVMHAGWGFGLMVLVTGLDCDAPPLLKN